MARIGLGLPTAAKLVSAITLSFTLMIMVYVIDAYLPDEELVERHEGALLWLFGLYGIWHGWFGLGSKASMEEGFGVYLGLRTAISVTIWLVFILAIWHVIGTILDQDLVGAEPMEAVIDMFTKAMEYFGMLLQPMLLTIFAGVGIVSGIAARSAARRWD